MCVIEAGGVVGATPQLCYFIWCSLLTVDCLVVERRNSEIMHLAIIQNSIPILWLNSVTFIAIAIPLFLCMPNRKQFKQINQINQAI